MRKKSVIALESTASCLPWFVMAGLSYLLLNWIAGMEINSGSIADPKGMLLPALYALLKGAAIGGKLLLPCLLAAAGMCSGIKWLPNVQLFIQQPAHPDQAVLKMPKIVRSDAVSFEAARQLRADSFAPLPYASAKSDKMFRKC